MDIKHRKAYARIKVPGQLRHIDINEGLSLVQLLAGRILKELQNAQNRYTGKIEIEIGFEPLEQIDSLAAKYPGIDLSNATPMTQEEEDSWTNSRLNPDSSNYDDLLMQYKLCATSYVRANKTPEELTLFRRHVETHYKDTEWWDGYHKW